MYFLQDPADLSLSINVAPVKAPKNSVFDSTAMGAVRTIVGVPTFPSRARTALGPRSSELVLTGAWPATRGFDVVGHLGEAPASVRTSRRSRTAASASAGL